MSLIYFAYGSNMSARRLLLRVGAARALGLGRLERHRLEFHKASDVDGSAKADIVECDRSLVHGMLFELSPREKFLLDLHEGLGTGYAEKQVTVTGTSGNAVAAFVYYATAIDRNRKPYDWYLRHIIEGAREAGLPDDYLLMLSGIEVIPDPDLKRARRELAIYD